MALVTIEASPRKRLVCPVCGTNMEYKGDGRYVCPECGGEFLRPVGEAEAPKEITIHVSTHWPELAAGTTGRMREAMRAVAEIPLGTADVVGPCQGHGGKGGSRSKGGGKSPARQKYDSWVRRTSPGRFIRSVRVG